MSRLLVLALRKVVEADFKTATISFEMDASSSEVKDYISRFKSLKNKNQIKDLKDKNIDSWVKQGWIKFKSFIDSFEGKKTKTQEIRETKAEGAELKAENEEWLVFKIKTKGACIRYGSKAKWCITKEDKKYFEDYSKDGDFYFFISKTRDEEDRWAKIAYLSEVERYWNLWNDPQEGEEYESLPSEIKKSLPKFKVDKFIPALTIEGKKYTYEEFYAASGLKVSGDLNFYGIKITSLPSDLEVGGGLYLQGTKITSLPPGLKVGGYLYLQDTEITSLPSGLKVSGDLNLYGTKITSLTSDLEVGGSLYLRGTKITSLPSGLKVGGGLYLRGSKITSLPSGLKVGGFLDLYGTKITSLPSDLKVGGTIYLPKGFEGETYNFKVKR